jgi:Calx-beta domain-containing protein
MKTKFVCGLITLLGVLALQSTAHATFHLMQIEQIIGSVDGDATVQAIQLRMRAAGQNFVSGGKLVVFDAAGLNPITIVDPTTNVTNGAVGDHVLIASANFASHTVPPAMADFIMTNLIPASYFAAGSLCWESNAGTIMWRLSWGGASYTGSNLGSTFNDMDGNFGPPFGSPLPSSGITAVQFQGPATALSTNNAADYLLTSGPVVFINNAGTSFTVMGALPTVTITAPDPNASEVPSTDVGRFRVSRTGDATSDLRVFYTIGGTATNGVDYRMLNGSATIRAGATAVSITLRPIDDTISEPDETAILTLSSDPNYIIGSPNTATVTIHSNE